ncbi:hypothetical protein IWX49DRAFT_565663 [Phyllosticta citricarpa]|uniref:Secreted protein n=2 Tax=Phyllosticta TaxID=121621 RepID=A0ABR1LWA2_9PEZI
MPKIALPCACSLSVCLSVCLFVRSFVHDVEDGWLGWRFSGHPSCVDLIEQPALAGGSLDASLLFCRRSVVGVGAASAGAKGRT